MDLIHAATDVLRYKEDFYIIIARHIKPSILTKKTALPYLTFA